MCHGKLEGTSQLTYSGWVDENGNLNTAAFTRSLQRKAQLLVLLQHLIRPLQVSDTKIVRGHRTNLFNRFKWFSYGKWCCKQ